MESVVVFRAKLKGAVVTAAPELAPSTLNCTLVVLAETLVATVVVPRMVVPETGDVIAMDGAEALLTVTATAALVAIFPPELLATAVSEWLPLDSVAVFSEKLNGAVVTAAPESLPSTFSCTLVVLEETLVTIEIVPEIVAPDIGDVIEIVGPPEFFVVM